MLVRSPSTQINEKGDGYDYYTKHLFGNTYALLVATLRRFGVKVRLRDLTNIEAVREAIDDDTCCVFLEILTNPQLEVADLKAISR